MPITVDTDPGRDRTIFKATGLLEFEEVVPVVRAFYENEPTPNLLWDLNDVPDTQISPEEMRTITSFKFRKEGQRTPGRTAFLVANDTLYGLSRIFEAQSAIQGAAHAVMVFKDMTSANSWLDGA